MIAGGNGTRSAYSAPVNLPWSFGWMLLVFFLPLCTLMHNTPSSLSLFFSHFLRGSHRRGGVTQQQSNCSVSLFSAG